VIVIFCLILEFANAQRLEYMQQVGYQNPFLKSGQFISNLYFYSFGNTSERDLGDTNFGEYSINLSGYLGLTDYLTFSTRITAYPEQKTYWRSGGEEGKREQSFNINPQITLSYRPMDYLEIYGSFDYQQYEITSYPESYYTSFPAGVDTTTGQIIYENRKIIMDAQEPYTTSRYNFRFGLTYSGRLW